MVASRRSTTQRGPSWWAAVVMAALGLVDAAYLTWIKLADATASCAGIGDCDAVNSSQYAEIAGIPIALLGAGAYALILMLLLLEPRFSPQAETLRLSVFGLSLAGTLYSAYLTYVEVAVLHAICPFCVVSAVLLVGLLVVSILRLRSSSEDQSEDTG